MKPEDIREMIGRFRILVIGRANAGKTTLLKRVCNTTEDPEIFDGTGKKIDTAIVESSVYRGEHDIKYEVVFKSNPNFVFHDSCGFEAGGEDEFKMMKEFVSERASTFELKERLHAIWYCIPMDGHCRTITKAEERFFSECSTSDVPVIILFTKFDALWDEAYGQLKDSGLTRAECKSRAPDHAKEIFAKAKTWDRLCKAPYPPKDHICLAEMEKVNADCGPLLECTANTLGEEAMQMLLISTQRTNLSLCVKYAVERVLISYVREAHTSTGTACMISEDTCTKMQKKISAWFPHTKEGKGLPLPFGRKGLMGLPKGMLGEREEREEPKLMGLPKGMLGEREEREEPKPRREPRRRGGWRLLLRPLGLEDFDPANILLGNSLERESAPLTSPQLLPFHNMAQTLQLGIALIIILEYSFFLLQEHQESKDILKLAATEYRTSQTQVAVEEAVKEVLQQDDGDDQKLCHMVIDIILRCRMSKVSLAQGRT